MDLNALMEVGYFISAVLGRPSRSAVALAMERKFRKKADGRLPARDAKDSDREPKPRVPVDVLPVDCTYLSLSRCVVLFFAF